MRASARSGGMVYQSFRETSRGIASYLPYTSTSYQFSSTELVFKRFATKKTGGASKNGRDSRPKFRGIKVQNGGKINAGQAILSQMGFKFHPGWNVTAKRNCTLIALTDGCVWFEKEVDGLNPKDRTLVHVLPPEEVRRRQKFTHSNYSIFTTQ